MFKEFNVLYVEDEETLLEITSDELSEFFKNVYTQTNGEDGFNFYKENKDEIDLVITDINMPLMNGIEMSKKIKEIDSSIPIIITSAHNDSEWLFQSINIGINGYILKPVFFNKLIKTISQVLEPKILQKELVRQTKFSAIGQLAAGLTHEINTPLTYMKLSAELMQFDIQDIDDEKIQNSLKKNQTVIIDGIHRLINIVESMKEMANNSSLEKTQVNVYETIVVACIMAHNKSKHIVNIYINNELFNLDMDRKKHTFDVYTQKQRIEQVWIILINNALDELAKSSNYDNRKFNITIEERDEDIKIEFIDNAGGIDDMIFETLFEPFKTTKKSSGMGIGLSLAKKFIDNQNGKISAYNQNGGAVFEVLLPKYKVEVSIAK